MYRDNTKPLTPSLKAHTGAANKTLNNIARPGKRNNRVPAGAESVMSANGKTPRPGYHQRKPAGGGTGSIARPGHAQGLNRGRNAK